MLIPRPKVHEVCYHGVLAANAALREHVVVVPTHRKKKRDATQTPDDSPEKHPKEASSRYSWAELIRLTFQTDLLTCNHCGAQRKIIAEIKDQVVIEQILTHLGLGSHTKSAPKCAQAPPSLGLF